MGRRGLFLCLLLLLCLLSGAAHADAGPGDVAAGYVQALADKDWAEAAQLCAEPGELMKWSAPVVTRDFVFPLLRDIRVTKEDVSGDTAVVTLSMSGIDFTTPLEDGWPLSEELLGDLLFSDAYNDRLDESRAWQDEEPVAFLARAEAHRKEYEIPYVLRRTDGEWKVDLAATLGGWSLPDATVAPVSYGMLTYDYAQKRYYAQSARYENLLECPEDEDWGQWLRRISAEEIFRAWNTQPYNVWLRLTAQGDAEGLYGFEVDGEDVYCAALLVDYPVFDTDIAFQRWVTIDNAQRGVLEMRLPAREGGPLENYTVSARHRANIWTPQYAERELSFSLAGTPYDSGCPEGSVTFTAQRLTRAGPASRETYAGTRTADTLGALMKDEFDGFDGESVYDSVFPDAPEGIGGLPILNDQYALYRLEGTVAKQSGYFGVYDVTFALASPVEGVWVEAYEQCGFDGCDEIDGFDLMGKESTLEEVLQGDFDVQVLVRIDGRTPEELEALVRSLPLTATISAEEWNFCYEQHGTTSRIGPRITLPVGMGV